MTDDARGWPELEPPDDPQAYVAQVMAEIAEEVRLRRASGDLPPRLERELDELFLAHSPVVGRGGDLSEALRQVDAATFIDPVVPVESERAAGAFVKKGMRSLCMWYVGWVTHQMSQSASAVSRALHIVDDRLERVRAAASRRRRFPMPRWSSSPASRCRRPGGSRRRVAALAKVAGTGPARGLRRRLVGPPTERSGGRRLRRRPPCGDRRPGRARSARPARRGLVRSSGAVAAARPGRRGPERDGRRAGRRGARRNCSRTSGAALAPGGMLVIHSATRRPGRRPTRRSKPTWLPGRPLRAERLVSQLLGASGYRPRHSRVRRGRRLPRRTAVRAATAEPHGAVSTAAGGPVAVHQFVPALNPHDATGTHTLRTA